MERGIYDLIFLCANDYRSSVTSIAAGAAFLHGMAYGSTVMGEYHRRLQDVLQREFSPKSPVYKLLPIFYRDMDERERYERVVHELVQSDDPSYLEWLERVTRP
jgi:hypothetical protein